MLVRQRSSTSNQLQKQHHEAAAKNPAARVWSALSHEPIFHIHPPAWVSKRRLKDVDIFQDGKLKRLDILERLDGLEDLATNEKKNGGADFNLRKCNAEIDEAIGRLRNARRDFLDQIRGKSKDEEENKPLLQNSREHFRNNIFELLITKTNTIVDDVFSKAHIYLPCIRLEKSKEIFLKKVSVAVLNALINECAAKSEDRQTDVISTFAADWFAMKSKSEATPDPEMQEKLFEDFRNKFKDALPNDLPEAWNRFSQMFQTLQFYSGLLNVSADVNEKCSSGIRYVSFHFVNVIGQMRGAVFNGRRKVDLMTLSAFPSPEWHEKIISDALLRTGKSESSSMNWEDGLIEGLEDLFRDILHIRDGIFLILKPSPGLAAEMKAGEKLLALAENMNSALQGCNEVLSDLKDRFRDVGGQEKKLLLSLLEHYKLIAEGCVLAATLYARISLDSRPEPKEIGRPAAGLISGPDAAGSHEQLNIGLDNQEALSKSALPGGEADETRNAARAARRKIDEATEAVQEAIEHVIDAFEGQERVAFMMEKHRTANYYYGESRALEKAIQANKAAANECKCALGKMNKAGVDKIEIPESEKSGKALTISKDDLSRMREEYLADAELIAGYHKDPRSMRPTETTLKQIDGDSTATSGLQLHFGDDDQFSFDGLFQDRFGWNLEVGIGFTDYISPAGKRLAVPQSFTFHLHLPKGIEVPEKVQDESRTKGQPKPETRKWLNHVLSKQINPDSCPAAHIKSMYYRKKGMPFEKSTNKTVRRGPISPAYAIDLALRAVGA